MLCLPSWYAQGTQQAQKSVSDRHNKKHSAQKITLLHPLCLSSKAGKADVLQSLQTAAVPEGGGGGFSSKEWLHPLQHPRPGQKTYTGVLSPKQVPKPMKHSTGAKEAYREAGEVFRYPERCCY